MFRLGPIGKGLKRAAVKKLTYVKDNLKVYFDFKSSRAKTLEFVGTGSHYFTTNDYITTTYSLGTASGFTFAFWMQDSALTQGDNYMDNRDSASDGVTFFGSSTNEMTLRINGNDVESSNDLTTGWNHIVGTYDGAIKTIYVNGVATSNAETSSINVAGNLRIGARSYSISNYVTGYMKNCAVWERALSASEVQNIMYKTYSDLKGTETTHLKAWGSMDSQVGSDGNAGSGYVLDEVSGAGSTTNLGTVSGATLKSGIYAGYSPRKPRGFDNAPEAQADLIGSGSASFTATNDDHILLASETNISSDFTLVCWMKPDSLTYEGILGGYSHSKSTFALQDADAIRFRLNKADDSSWWYADWDCGFADWSTTNWQHLAVTKEGTTLTPYLDGVKGTTGTLNGSGGVLKVQMIGGHNAANSMGNEFDGNLAQIGIFSSKLTQEQIQSISQKTYSELTADDGKDDLVHWWGLDEETATDGTAGTGGVKDSHGTNHGTLA